MTASEEALNESVESRIVGGFARLCLALRSMKWAQSAPGGFTPSQGQILALLRSRGPCRLSQIAHELGVRQPTATEAVNTLVRKALVAKSSDKDDARAVILSLTTQGQRAASQCARVPPAMLGALSGLNPEEQAELLRALSKTIRALQIAREITPARLCITCRYFQPNIYDGPARHHCGMVDAPFGDRELRLDCPEQEPATEAEAQANFARFEAGSASSSPAG